MALDKITIDKRTIDQMADCYTFVVDPDGTCVLYPRLPELVGTRPWDWCILEDEPRCREAFVQACMFRKPQKGVELRVRYEGRVFRLSFRLYPLETGQVLCLFHRIFDGDLTARQRHVLALVGGGADAGQVASALSISESTARDHIASIKRKLNIQHPEGFRLAAHHFGVAVDDLEE